MYVSDYRYNVVDGNICIVGVVVIMRKQIISDKRFFQIMGMFTIMVVSFTGVMVVASLMDGTPQEVETYTMDRLPASWRLNVFMATQYGYPLLYPEIDFLTCSLVKYNGRTISVTIDVKNAIFQCVYMLLPDLTTSADRRVGITVPELFDDIQYLGNESVVEVTIPESSKYDAFCHYVLYVAVIPMAWNDGVPVFSAEVTIQLLDV